MFLTTTIVPYGPVPSLRNRKDLADDNSCHNWISMPPPSSAALPLNVASTVTPSKAAASPVSITGSTTSAANASKPVVNTSDISSPHELTAFVETLLEQLDAKFDDMSNQILDRMTQMSTRVDALEASIQDIINGDATAAPTSLPQSPVLRKSGV